jgi:hypothetical protein
MTMDSIRAKAKIGEAILNNLAFLIIILSNLIYRLSICPDFLPVKTYSANSLSFAIGCFTASA